MLLAYVKIGLETRDPRRPARRRAVDGARCWPTTSRRPLRERFADRMAGHRLRRGDRHDRAGQRGGQPRRHRRSSSGRWRRPARPPADVIRAYVVVRDVFGLPELWDAVEAARQQGADRGADRPSTSRLRRLLDRAVRWLVANRRSPIDVPGEIARLRPGVQRLLLPELDDALPSAPSGQALRAHVDAARPSRGLPADARPTQSPGVMYGFGLLDIVETAQSTGRDVDEVASRLLRDSPSGSGSTRCCRRSRCCRARTGGRRWPGWRCATTCTRRSRR